MPTITLLLPIQPIINKVHIQYFYSATKGRLTKLISTDKYNSSKTSNVIDKHTQKYSLMEYFYISGHSNIYKMIVFQVIAH